jgi:hypothetical protein
MLDAFQNVTGTRPLKKATLRKAMWGSRRKEMKTVGRR